MRYRRECELERQTCGMNLIVLLMETFFYNYCASLVFSFYYSYSVEVGKFSTIDSVCEVLVLTVVCSACK